MPRSDPSPDKPAREGDLWLGIGLIATSLVALLLARSIQTIGLGDNFDPGSKAFPIGLSSLLAVGGLVELWRCRRSLKPGARRLNAAASDSKTKSVLILLGLFLIYVLLLPWLGFAISTLVMATVMMKLLGNAWKSSLLVSIVLITLIYFLFVMLFKVPLPGGIMNLPF